MRVIVELDLETSTGDYGITFRCPDNPGASIDYTEMMKVLARIFEDVETKAATGGAER